VQRCAAALKNPHSRADISRGWVAYDPIATMSPSRRGEPPTVTVETHLQGLLEKLPVCLTRVARDGTLLAVNDAALVMLGGDTLSQVLGKPLQSFVTDDPNACRRFIERVTAGERSSVQLEMQGLEGHASTLQVSAIPSPDHPDGVSSALLAFRDITEQRRLEQSLIDVAGHDRPAADEPGSRIQELERALLSAQERCMELEVLLGERDGMVIDLDAELESPKSMSSKEHKG